MSLNRTFRRRGPHILLLLTFASLSYFLCLYMGMVPDEFNLFLSLEYHALEEGKETTEFTDRKCVLPKLDPFRKEVMEHIKTLPPLKCKEKRYGTIVGQEIHLHTQDLKDVKMFYIRRPKGDDFNVEYSKAIDLKVDGNLLVIKPKEELVKLKLTRKDGTVIMELHALIIPKQDVVNQARPLEHDILDLQLNVAVIMVESLSAAMFERSLPITKKVLMNLQNTFFFKGHTIVGDGTTAQLCAILTGKNEQQLPEARRSFKNSGPVDSWPFIFKDFEKKGYVTMFIEDAPKYASFNYRLHGFREPPTHHYSRPFVLSAQKTNDYGDCFGSWAAHNYSLSYSKSFFREYKNYKKFSLTNIARLPHNNLNKVQLMDQDFANFLLNFQEEGYLENSIIFILGDHGPRMSASRSSLAGKVEERLPFFSVTLPKWLKARQNSLVRAMSDNTNVLTSHFDVYGTLQHVLQHPDFPSVPTGQSLFQKIDPDTRNCKSAGVADHWCPCLGYLNMSNTNPLVLKLAKKSVSFINGLVSFADVPRSNCVSLTLDKIIRAGKVAHNWKMESFRNSKGNSRCDSCLLVFKKEKRRSASYEVVFTVKPSGGMYEVTIKDDRERMIVDPNISRINRYGDQPKCIAAAYPHLRKYCFCKTQD